MRDAFGVRSIAAALLFLLSAAFAPATSYLPLSDVDLALRAPVIVRAQVVGQETRIEVEGTQQIVCTLTTFRALDVLKGSMTLTTFNIELPGGKIGGLATLYPGTPDFSGSDEVILFVSPNRWHEGNYALTELGLSHFDVVVDSQGRRFATRPAFTPEEDDHLSQRPGSPVSLTKPSPTSPDVETARPLRDADSFLEALRAIGSGLDALPVDYAAPQGETRKTPPGHVRPLWVNISGTEPGNCSGQPCLFRWYWDTHESPSGVVTITGSQSNLSDGSDGHALVAAMVNQWASVSGATVLYSSGGIGGNVTVNLEVANQGTAWTTPLLCNTGGVVGYGGPNSSPQASNPTFKGDSPYYAIPGGNVWIRQQTGNGGCFPVGTFQSDALHEMGHTLGLGHPDQAASIHSSLCPFSSCTAVMRSTLTGATTPQSDDIGGIQWYYGTSGGGSGPTANFSFLPSSPQAGQAVNFTDTSTGSPTSWSWNFGDGGTSTQQNPTHTFAQQGTYSVTLTATNANGSNAISKSVQVGAMGAPVANFSFSPPVAGQPVSFTDISTGSPTSWTWNFGDGGTSTQQNPTHTFAQPGTYTVTLTATNAYGSNVISKSVQVCAACGAPVADFSFSPSSPPVGQPVSFTDASFSSPTSWTWNFGDGGASTQQNPIHTFAQQGTYNVTLTATNAYGSNAISKSVQVGSAPLADFSFLPSSPLAGQPVSFTDASFGSPTSWAWNFGDGGASTQQNPIHTFAQQGTYNVTLTATNAYGSNAISKFVGAAGQGWTAINSGLTNTTVNALAIDPSAPATLYAGTDGGVFKSSNGGQSWTAVNSGLTSNSVHVNALAIDPSAPSTLYAGTSSGGVFKSINGGQSWTAVNSGLTSTQVVALAIDPSAPATLYAGTTGGGVSKSINGGQSWTAVNSGLPSTFIFALAIDPSAPSTLYAGTSSGGVFKSINGGQSWTAINSGLTDTSVEALAIDPSAPATLYAGTGGGGGVSKSINGGQSWTAVNYGLTSTLIFALAIDPSAPSTLYAGTFGGGVFAYKGPPALLHFVPITPCRVVDTRLPNGAYGGPVLTAGVPRSFVLSMGPCVGIPAGVGAYSVNVTVTGAQSFGYLTMFPQGTAQPLVSTLNYGQGETVANAAIVPAGSSGGVTVFSYAQAHVIIDIDGYFVSGGGLGFVPVTPCRVVDTRLPNGPYGGPNLGAAVVRSFDLSKGPCAGIPAGVGAYSVNVTVTGPRSFGYVTAFPQGTSQPLVSTLNYGQGQTVANAAIVPAGAGSGVTLFSYAATDLIIDINGYFASGGTLGFVPVTPCRVVDTRTANGPFGGPNLVAGAVRSFDLSNGPCADIPAGVGAYSLNATVTGAQSFGFLTLFPQGGTQPLVSTLNYGQGQTLANAAIVPAGPGGISVFSFAGTHVIFDIAGYFKPF